MGKQKDVVEVERSDLGMLLGEANDFMSLINELASKRHKLDAHKHRALIDALEMVARQHASVNLLKLRLEALLKPKDEPDKSDPDKTPPRPSSAAAVQAFKESGEFGAVKKP